MNCKCVIDNHRSTKKGLTITLRLDEKQKKLVMPHLHNFEDMPLDVLFKIDGVKQQQILEQINEQQRKKIYAILKDIGNHFGYTDDDAKMIMKPEFLQAYAKYEEFSLSNCTKELACDFITFLIMWCFKNGVPLKEHPREAIDDDERYFWICLKLKKCCITGQPGQIHHVDAIGMGRDRKHYDDSQHLKICLSPAMHREAHQIGWQTFAQKYCVKGIIYNG